MRTWGCLIGALALIFTFSSFKLADRILDGEVGNYFVTEQDNNYSLLFLRESTDSSLLFEEISIPTHLIKKSSTDWKKWLSSGAPGHTSWIQYEIDPVNLHLLEAYSFSRKGWLYLDESDHFLSKLLSLPLTQIKEEERKKIGPAPKGDEIDRRKVWNPPLVSEGSKIKTFSEAWKAVWPQDSSLLSSCQITLYFPPKEISTFPSWIEASNGHFNYSVKMVDSGKNMSSPLTRRIPYRPPQLLKHIQKNAKQVDIPIKAPAYYKSFALFAFDLSRPGQHIGPIPFELSNGEKKEDRILTVSLENLVPLFEKNHHYKWLLMPQGPESFIIESEDFFRWGPQKN
jgi:hypothetical protein